MHIISRIWRAPLAAALGLFMLTLGPAQAQTPTGPNASAFPYNGLLWAADCNNISGVFSWSIEGNRLISELREGQRLMSRIETREFVIGRRTSGATTLVARFPDFTESFEFTDQGVNPFDPRQPSPDNTYRYRRCGPETLAYLAIRGAPPPAVARQSVTTERRVALIVGNSAYKTRPLINPGNDANDMARELRDLGFQTQLVLDASRARMREATRQFAQAASQSDVALIFFAGHGVESKGRNFLIPVDADLKHEYELEDQAFDAAQWMQMLEQAGHGNARRVNILILDACRNNDLTRGWRSMARGLARMDAPTGTFVSFSTAPGQVADDGEGQRNSPFTRHLLRAMRQPGQPIELTFKEVRRAVIDETKGSQVPWDNSSLVGNFMFKASP